MSSWMEQKINTYLQKLGGLSGVSRLSSVQIEWYLTSLSPYSTFVRSDLVDVWEKLYITRRIMDPIAKLERPRSPIIIKWPTHRT